MKGIIDNVCYIVSFFINWNVIKCFRYVRYKTYSYAASRHFAKKHNYLQFAPGMEIIGEQYITFGKHFCVGKNFVITAFSKMGNKRYKPKIVIGNNVRIINNCHISAINFIHIGDNSLIASDVYISDHAHGKCKSWDDVMVSPMERPLYSKGSVIIKQNVWIGEKVTILPNVVIGENSVIGANSVVCRDIPPNCVACGNPAIVIRKLEKSSR